MIAKVNVVKDKLEQNELCPALFASFRRFGFISRRGRELSVAAKAFVELVKKSPLPIVHQPARSPGGQATLSEAPVTHAPSSATSQPRAPEALLTPLRFIERSARVYPGKLAVRYGQPDQTYSQFARRVRQLASALRQAGLQPGDRVAFICANLPPLLEAHFGVPLAGGVLVPINVRLAAGEIACILNHSGARFLFVDSQFSASVRPLRGHLETPLEMIDIVDGQRTKPLGNLTYEDFLESGSAKTATWPLKNEDELISLNYTSGTTGKPKGVMFSHRGAYLNALGNIIELGLTSASIVLWTLPMFHCNGWGLTWAATAVGATHICLRKFEDATIWRLITMENVSHLCGAPSLMAHLLNCPDRPTALRQPLAVFVGGAPPSAELIQQWEALGARFLHGYGLTETCGGYVICEPQPEWAKLPPAERARLLRRQGVPFVTGDALRIVD